MNDGACLYYKLPRSLWPVAFGSGELKTLSYNQRSMVCVGLAILKQVQLTLIISNTDVSKYTLISKELLKIRRGTNSNLGIIFLITPLKRTLCPIIRTVSSTTYVFIEK